MKKIKLFSSNSDPDQRSGFICIPKIHSLQLKPMCKGWQIPDELLLDQQHDRGILIGLPDQDKGEFVGIPEEMEGNLLVIGGNGSGKSCGVAKPTLESWNGPIVATDLKGELSAHYQRLYRRGCVSRRCIVVDPMNPAGPSYDPYWLLTNDEADNLVQNAFGLAAILCPESHDDKDRFWSQSEQAVVTAAIVWSVRRGLSFSEMAAYMLSKSLKEFCRELLTAQDGAIQSILGGMDSIREETLGCIERGIRNRLMISAADPRISHFLRGRGETGNWFHWDDLENFNIFLCIPPDKLEVWGWVVNLMCSQLIRHLEQRPEQHSPQGKHIPQTLLLLDEFPRFGKLEPISNALATLRSKGVTFCLVAQSVAQLDLIYGKLAREIISDNCRFKLILQAGDPETQTYFSQLIGSELHLQNNLSINLNASGKQVEGLNMGISENRDFRIHPHQLAALEKPVFLTPMGNCQVNKFPPDNFVRQRKPNKIPPDDCGIWSRHEPWVKEDVLLSLHQRTENARGKLLTGPEQQHAKHEGPSEQSGRKKQRCIMAVGAAVLQYFPDLYRVDPGCNKAEAQENLRIVNHFLDALFEPENAAILRQLQDKANRAYIRQTVTTNPAELPDA